MDLAPRAPLEAKPVIEMAMYDQKNRVSGANMHEATQDEDLLTLGGEGGHGAADCLLELLSAGRLLLPMILIGETGEDEKIQIDFLCSTRDMYL